MSIELILGTQPGELTVVLIGGDPWSASLYVEENGVPIAWPAAPILEFAGGPDVEAEISDYTDPDDEVTVDGLATWSLTEEQVDDMADRTKVRLAVDDITWFMGRAECLS